MGTSWSSELIDKVLTNIRNRAYDITKELIINVTRGGHIDYNMQINRVIDDVINDEKEQIKKSLFNRREIIRIATKFITGIIETERRRRDESSANNLN